MRISGFTQHNIYQPAISKPKIAGGCPHGNPPGACPICLGMGGGGGGSAKSKPTPKELGLLTWADLLPAWYAMQAAKHQKEDAAVNQRMIDMQKLAERARLFDAVNNFVSTKIMPAVKFIDEKIFSPIAKTVNASLKALNSLFSEIKNYMMNQLVKNIIVINEKINAFMEKLKGSLETFKTAMERFISEWKEKEKDLKTNLYKYAKNVRDNLLGIIQAIGEMLNQQETDENSEEENKQESDKL